VRGEPWSGRVDLDALLTALVLVPHSYSRNRFFGLYTWPAARRVRRRAALLRSVIDDLALAEPKQPAEALGRIARDRGQVLLAYRLPALGARRTVWLEPDELDLVRLAVARARRRRADHCVPATDIDGSELDPATWAALERRVAAVLQRLCPRSPLDPITSARPR